MSAGPTRTALVLAGGGSLGAVQVGMLAELVRDGFKPDFVIGSSVGALNAAFFAGSPTQDGVARLAQIWRAMRRSDVFPVTLGGAIQWLRSSGALFDQGSLRKIVEKNLPFRNLEDAPIPLHVVATNLGGMSVCLSSGTAADAILASAAIPVVFPPVAIGGEHLMDGAISGNTPILDAAALGATRMVILPTGFACALEGTPRGAVAYGMHALTLMISHQVVRDLAHLAGKVEVVTVPSLCPLNVSPFDFSQSDVLMTRAAATTRAWLDAGGMSRQETPAALLPHTH